MADLLSSSKGISPDHVNEELDKLCMAHFGNKPYVADGIFRHSADTQWAKAHPRVLFVLKQPNSNDLLGEDYRDYTINDMLGNQNWEQLLARLYGIMHATKTGFPSYEEATRPEMIRQTFRDYPFAMINIIKDDGSGTTDTNTLFDYTAHHADFIRSQINILRPDLIVCCGRGVYGSLNPILTPSIPASNAWVKVNEALGITFFDTWHPGKPNTTKKLKEAYEEPLKEYIELVRD